MGDRTIGIDMAAGPDRSVVVVRNGYGFPIESVPDDRPDRQAGGSRPDPAALRVVPGVSYRHTEEWGVPGPWPKPFLRSALRVVPHGLSFKLVAAEPTPDDEV